VKTEGRLQKIMQSRGTSGYQNRDRDNGYNHTPTKAPINPSISQSRYPITKTSTYEKRTSNSRPATSGFDSRMQTPLRDRSRSSSAEPADAAYSSAKKPKGSVYDQTPERKTGPATSSFAAREQKLADYRSKYFSPVT